MSLQIQRVQRPLAVRAFPRDVDHAIRNHKVSRPVAENIFARELWQCLAAIDIATGNADALHLRVFAPLASIFVSQNRIDERLAVRADFRTIIWRIARLLWIETNKALANVPAVVAALLHDIDFLP